MLNNVLNKNNDTFAIKNYSYLKKKKKLHKIILYINTLKITF